MSANSFVHLLLTRFNTAMDYAPSSKRLDCDWLNQRLALFERYCLPSVKGQRNAEFQWLIFFDDESPAWFKQHVESFRPLVLPIYINGPATDAVLADRVRETGLVTTPYLLTTRLDNDDALACSHMAQVQQAFHRQDREFIEFPFGLQSFRDRLYSVYWPSNPFLSLVENIGNGKPFTTVLSVPHNCVRKSGTVKSIVSSPQWLQVLHSSNVLNSLRGWPRIGAESHSNFNVFWPESQFADSFPARMTFSVNSYATRISRRLNKSFTRLKKSMSFA